MTSPEDTQSAYENKRKIHESESMKMEYHLLSSRCLNNLYSFIAYCSLLASQFHSVTVFFWFVFFFSFFTPLKALAKFLVLILGHLQKNTSFFSLLNLKE